MRADTKTLRCLAAATLVVFVALAGCKNTNKDTPGLSTGGGARGKDPLVAGPNLIPKQNVPVPERGIGTKGKTGDPLLGNPTGKAGDKVGYNDSPERFKGTFIPGKPSTPASLAGRIKDGEELKIESPGVKLQPAGGVEAVDGPDPDAAVAPLYARLEQLGVKSQDRELSWDGKQWVFFASVSLGREGPRRGYSGSGNTQAEAVKSVVDQISAERK